MPSSWTLGTSTCGNIGSSEAKLKDALKLAENNSLSDNHTIDLLDRLGTVRRELGRFEKAKANARSATKRLKAAPQFEEQLRDRVFGNFKKAKMMLKVMQAKESGDVPTQIRLAEKLGDLNADLLRPEDAIAQYGICAQLMEVNGSDASARAPIYSSLAITFYESGNLKQAIRYHTKELEMHRQTGNRKCTKTLRHRDI